MTGVVLLAAMFALLIRAICKDVRKQWAEEQMCERIQVQQALGVRERLHGCEIAERRAR